MQMSEYIKECQKLVDKHGDRPIVTEEDLDPYLPEYQDEEGGIYVVAS